MFTDILVCIRATRQYPVEKDFERCVDSIVKNTKDFRFIFVDDNSDRDGCWAIEKIAAQFPTCVLIRTHTQNWFTKAHNKGLRLVRTQRAIMMNCDTWVGENWLEELNQCWDEAEQTGPVGLVGSVYSEPEQRRWFATKDKAYVTGHCYLLNMDALQKVSESRGMPGWYFDETNFRNAHIHSDVELCWTLNRLGYQTIQSHKSYVMHVGGKSWGHNLGSLAVITPEYLRRIDGQ